VLSSLSKSEFMESEYLDPFDAPEYEAFDISLLMRFYVLAKYISMTYFGQHICRVSLFLCKGSTSCLYVQFFNARTASQGHGEDYEVQLAVGQCPRSCIPYVTPSQRVILEELLGRYTLTTTKNVLNSYLINLHCLD
ncbi:hypothetical protein M8C21_015532, partial [Ambrosia artemisiifolia]